APQPAAAPTPAADPAPAAAADAQGTPLTAPMPGMIVKYTKQVGDSVSKGDSVVILEAMKMENALPAPVDGTIKAINFSSGDSVAKDAVLCVIG
ncbi:MAG: acetyl-CoA carboxylase biotin carboxyl carrier protein subunit, partial [Deltaproteobacteria bacterium]|nr:acetyl-CoA carboxylase biotin carboxyl carrier protein subunit [Deltaproteobacteria bacterium]